MADGNHPLERLVDLLKPEASPETLADAEALQYALAQLAQWRLACGDLEGAAHWQQTTLCTPDPGELRRALLPLLRDRADLRRALGHADADWLPLVRALIRGHYAKAARLQTELLESDSPPESQLESLLGSWLQAGQPERALELLEAWPGAAADLEQIGNPATASAIAWALQTAQRQQEAIPWWQHSLRLDPQQIAVAEMLKNLTSQREPSQDGDLY